jgi:5-methylcytosine-specific restriction endonuclease McrA
MKSPSSSGLKLSSESASMAEQMNRSAHTAHEKLGSKERIRQFFLANIGKVVTSIQLRHAAGPHFGEWARHVRELREDEHWQILTHHDSADLRPGQYLLEEVPPGRPLVKYARGLSAKLRAEVHNRKGFTCQMCGIAPGDIDPATGRPVRLHLGHIKDRSLGGKDELSNLRILCSTCNQGAKNITVEKPTTIWLLSQVRRAGQEEQMAVLRWLRKKFGQVD